MLQKVNNDGILLYLLPLFESVIRKILILRNQCNPILSFLELHYHDQNIHRLVSSRGLLV